MTQILETSADDVDVPVDVCKEEPIQPPRVAETTAEMTAETTAETAALLATMATGLAACGGAGDGGVLAAPAAGVAPNAAANLAQPAAASRANDASAGAAVSQNISRTEYTAGLVRFLLQAQFGATSNDITSLRQIGIDAWLTQQFNAPMSEGGYDWLVSTGHTNATKGEYFSQLHADYMIWKQLCSAPDQMRMRVSLALSEIFVVSTTAIENFWPCCFMAAYWDLLVKNAFGNFRTLLEDITLNAAMGRYLNTLGNLKEDPATGRLPDENYAREVMQLFTIGVNQLNLDGTAKLDANGKTLDTYTQSDVSNLARVFTGYDYDNTGVTYTNPPLTPYPIPSPENARNKMRLDPSKHSNLAATFLGTTVPANTLGAAALKMALDTLFNHPNVGPFFAKQMIQRLVTSNPSPAYVQRVASVFNNNGAGVRGDMKAFWRAILTDVETQAPTNGATLGKLREPMIRAVQWVRTFNGYSVDGKWEIFSQSSDEYALAQSPLRAPSVFNFFRPGYVPPTTAVAAAGLVAPEFQIHNETSIVSYVNYVINWVRGGFGSGRILPDYGFLLPLAADAVNLVAWMNMYLTANQLTDKTVKLIYQSVASFPVSASSSDADKLTRIHAVIFLIMVCPEYLIQK
jgi:uncharacterized protein (DUF1800 family)